MHLLETDKYRLVSSHFRMQLRTRLMFGKMLVMQRDSFGHKVARTEDCQLMLNCFARTTKSFLRREVGQVACHQELANETSEYRFGALLRDQEVQV